MNYVASQSYLGCMSRDCPTTTTTNSGGVVTTTTKHSWKSGCLGVSGGSRETMKEMSEQTRWRKVKGEMKEERIMKRGVVRKGGEEIPHERNQKR